MSIPSIDERLKVAERLRNTMCMHTYIYPLCILHSALIGGECEPAERDDEECKDYCAECVLSRLADLIDPTPWERTVEDSHRLIDRCRELERENAALKNRIGWTDAHGLSLARPYLLRIARDLEREGLDGRAVTVDVGGYAERIREAVGSDAD